jgi:hypothetical protein
MKIRKIFNNVEYHKHDWVYYDYVPYTGNGIPNGAGYRVCKKCNEKQTSW